jgi:hypothetical protein
MALFESMGSNPPLRWTQRQPPSNTYTPSEVQAILAELRDLKTKLRSAGILAIQLFGDWLIGFLLLKEQVFSLRYLLRL